MTPHARAPGPPGRSLAFAACPFRDGKAALIEHFRSRPRHHARPRHSLLKALTRHVDETAGRTSGLQHAGDAGRAALVAVGGYGRGELFPHSDVDVLVLLPEHGERHRCRCGPAIDSRGFITACWDIGLEIGSSVRSVDRVPGRSGARRDGADRAARVAPGVRPEAPGLHRLPRRLPGKRDGPTRLPAREDAGDAASAMSSTKARLTRWNPTARKARAACATCRSSSGWPAPRDSAAPGAELAAKGLITPFEASATELKQEGTLQAHPRPPAPRRGAARGPPGVRPADGGGRELRPARPTKAQRSSEVLMHRYYWAAKAVTQLNQILMLNIEERIVGSEAKRRCRPITGRFLDRGRRARSRARRALSSRSRTPSSRPSWSLRRRPACRG